MFAAILASLLAVSCISLFPLLAFLTVPPFV